MLVEIPDPTPALLSTAPTITLPILFVLLISASVIVWRQHSTIKTLRRSTNHAHGQQKISTYRNHRWASCNIPDSRVGMISTWPSPHLANPTFHTLQEISRQIYFLQKKVHDVVAILQSTQHGTHRHRRNSRHESTGSAEYDGIPSEGDGTRIPQEHPWNCHCDVCDPVDTRTRSPVRSDEREGEHDPEPQNNPEHDGRRTRSPQRQHTGSMPSNVVPFNRGAARHETIFGTDVQSSRHQPRQNRRRQGVAYMQTRGNRYNTQASDETSEATDFGDVRGVGDYGGYGGYGGYGV